MAAVSPRMRATRLDDTPAVVETVTTICGEAGRLGLESRGAASNAAAARLVGMSILSAVDERRHEKFGVRSRADRTLAPHGVRVWDCVAAPPRRAPSDDEIDGDDVRREAHTVLRHRHVHRVLLVGVEAGAILEGDHQPRVVRTR